MAKTGNALDQLPKVWPGATDDGAIGLELSAFGGSSGIYVTPEGGLTVESESPAGDRLQFFHSRPDADLGQSISTDEHTFTLQGDRVVGGRAIGADGQVERPLVVLAVKTTSAG